jgi:hypothetical protein
MRTGQEWLTEMLSTPRNEFPEFPAALSFLFGITPGQARAALERRAELLGEKLAELDRDLHSESGPPRLFLVESEYLRAVTSAELDWVSGIIEDMRTGRLTWNYEELAALAQHFLPPD